MLEDKRIRELKRNEVLINVDDQDIQPISADLNIDSVVFWALDEESIDDANFKEMKKIQDSDICITYQTPYQLRPHETVFVKTKEGLKLPDNLVGHIVEKNSVMRLGLQVTGPLYQPTHQTAIYLRVTNLSDYIVELHKGFSIAQITFEEINPPDTPYALKKGMQYNDEFTFTAPHKLIKRAVKPEEQFSEQIKSVESKVLSVFTMFMGAFVSALALIVVDFQQMDANMSVKELIQMNITLAVCIAIILLSVFKFYFHLSSPTKRGMRGKKIKGMRKFFDGIQLTIHQQFMKLHIRKSSPKIYIAACYREHERNTKLFEMLQKNGIPAFLPESMHLRESTDKKDQTRIFHSCYYKLSKCDIVLVLCPFGKSVSAEIGYAIALNKKIIEYKPKNVKFDKECMIDPGFNLVVESEAELIQLLKNLVG